MTMLAVVTEIPIPAAAISTALQKSVNTLSIVPFLIKFLSIPLSSSDVLLNNV